MSYEIGQGVEIQGDFVDANGAPKAPTLATAKVRHPDGTVADVAVSLVAGSTASYTGVVVPDVAGRWYYRFIGTGDVTAQREQMFTVDEALVV